MVSKHIPCTLPCSLTRCAAHSHTSQEVGLFQKYVDFPLGTCTDWWGCVGSGRGSPSAVWEQTVGLEDWNRGAGTPNWACAHILLLLSQASSCNIQHSSCSVSQSPPICVKTPHSLVSFVYEALIALEMPFLSGREKKKISKKINISKDVTKKKCDFKFHCNSRWCR